MGRHKKVMSAVDYDTRTIANRYARDCYGYNYMLKRCIALEDKFQQGIESPCIKCNFYKSKLHYSLQRYYLKKLGHKVEEEDE